MVRRGQTAGKQKFARPTTTRRKQAYSKFGFGSFSIMVSLPRGRRLMQLEVFTLCDAATEHARKLNIIGTFDSLRAFEAPISHPQCAIAGRLRFEQIEEGEHRV